MASPWRGVVLIAAIGLIGYDCNDRLAKSEERHDAAGFASLQRPFGRCAMNEQIVRSNPAPTVEGGSGNPVPTYMSGFANSFETEALPGALPVGRNSPQKVSYGLYAEQLSGSAFTAPQAANQRTWVYRIRPSVRHVGPFEKIDRDLIRTAPERDESELPLGPLRWSPVPIPTAPLTFVSGLRTITTAGDCETLAGMASHLCLVTRSMVNEHFATADGELLVVAQEGRLRFRTELGVIDIEPGEICVIPRGVIFRVELIDGPARAYVCENYGGSFALPDRGPIGANCLANPRDFLTPVAAYEDIEEPCTLILKWGGELHRTEVPHSPLDVVAWHGRYYPYKYDLRRFCPVGAILYDHPDPSIYTVLTAPSETPGTANVDFVIFPERWAVAEDTFRPPWYHRNIMSEFMGLVYGVYDAKPEGFVPGGMSLHNQMLPHGPDGDAFTHASNTDLKPVKLTNTLAFMFETRFRQRVTKYAASLDTRQADYAACWGGLKKHFNPSRRDPR
jgi:homogentisate 1,2-dioxygenase